jgi:hypothetical protein
MSSDRLVFLNCPYDSKYRPFLWALVFAVCDSGFMPQAALSVADASTTRLDKLVQLITGSKYSIHDLRLSTRVRFNMPFELGLAMGLARGGSPSIEAKQICVLATDLSAFEKSCSDLKGIDPLVYAGGPEKLALAVARWLGNFQTERRAPSAGQLMKRFELFWKCLPRYASAKGFALHDASWPEMLVSVYSYLERNPPDPEAEGNAFFGGKFAETLVSMSGDNLAIGATPFVRK